MSMKCAESYRRRPGGGKIRGRNAFSFLKEVLGNSKRDKTEGGKLEKTTEITQ